MIGLAARLQAYLRAKAHRDRRERFPLPPFTLFLNPTVNDPNEGIAIPDAADTYTPDDVARVCAAFTQRGRVPCVQYLDAFAPGLAITLQLGHSLTPPPNRIRVPVYREGEWQTDRMPAFAETLRLPVMYCTARMLRHPPDVPGLTVTIISSESPLDEVKTNWNVNAHGFESGLYEAMETFAQEFQQTLVERRAFTAYVQGEPVAAGLFTEIRDGLTELVGITTLPEYRRQGIGAALTAFITRAAFDSGAEVVFLIVANDAAGRVYERLGFRTVARLLEYEQQTN